MSNEKLFKIVGVSIRHGQTKVRHASDMSRRKTLEKTDHTEIHLFEMGSEKTKLEAAKWLKGHAKYYATLPAGHQKALEDYIKEESAEAKKTAKTTSSGKAQGAKQQVAAKAKGKGGGKTPPVTLPKVSMQDGETETLDPSAAAAEDEIPAEIASIVGANAREESGPGAE